MNQPHIVYIADVYCPWCFGFGPIMKSLADAWPQFPIRVIGGNLMARDTNLVEYAAGDSDLYNFWLEVEETTGRSLAGALAALRNHEPIRMYSPGADLILTALKHMVPGNELEQLLLLEDMFYGEGRDLFTADSLEIISRRWNVSPNALKEACNSPTNEGKTAEDLERAAELMGEITAYPSVLLVRGENIDAVSRGYVHYETVERRLQDAMTDLGLEDLTSEYCSWHGNCAFGPRRPM